FADARILVVIVATTMAAALAIGMAPVLRARRTDLVRSFTAGSRYTDGLASRTRMILLTAQLSLSVVLLIGAGPFVRTFQNASTAHLGYDGDPIVVVSEHRRGNQRSPGAAWSGVETRLAEAAAGLPGARAASPAATVPFWAFEGRAVSTKTRSTQEI